MAKPTDVETPLAPAEPACGEPAEPDPDEWPEIVFPEPGDGEHLIVTTTEGAILVIGREYYQPSD